MRTLTGGSEHVYAVAFSPDGRWLASGGRERSAVGTLWKQVAGDRLSIGKNRPVRLWRADNGELQEALGDHPGDVHAVAFSPDGAWLAASGEAQVVSVWSLHRTMKGD